MDDMMVVTFETSGEVTAMHRDSFSLGFLGAQQVARASEITFKEKTQKWDVHVPLRPGDPVDRWYAFLPAQGFNSYNGARAFEVQWLELCALDSVTPVSDFGRAIAEKLRLNYVEKA